MESEQTSGQRTAERLATLLDSRGETELLVLKLIVTVRKQVERQALGTPELSRLKFYLSIPLHARLQEGPAITFLQDLDIPMKQLTDLATPPGSQVPHEMAAALGHFVSFNELRALMSSLLREIDMADDWMN